MAAKVTDDNVIQVDAIAIANANAGLTPRGDFDIARSLAERGDEFKGAAAQIAALGVIKFWSDNHDSVALKTDPDDVAEKYSLASVAAEVLSSAKGASTFIRAARVVIMASAYGKRPKQGKGKQKQTAQNLRIAQGLYDACGRAVAEGIRFACIVVGLHLDTEGNASPANMLALYDALHGFPFKRADFIPGKATTAKPDDRVFADNRVRIGYLTEEQTPEVARANVATLRDVHLPKNENADTDDDTLIAEYVEFIVAFLKDKTTANVIEATKGKLKDLSAAIIAFDNRNTAAPKASKAKA